MTVHDDLERQLATWADQALPPPSRHNLEAVDERTKGMRQRPAWASLERWLPMAVLDRPATAPPLRAAWLTFLTFLIIALAVGAAVIGSGLLRSEAALVLPPPTGPAGNGLIAYDAGGDIWTMRPDGGDHRQLTSGPAMDAMPIWSPDGTRLAFWSFSIPGRTAASSEDAAFFEGTASIQIIDAAGAPRGVLASDLRFDTSYGMPVSWAPDSEHIVYGHIVDLVPVMDVAGLDGSHPTRVGEGHSPTWSPSGDLIAYRTYTGPWHVSVVHPDGSGTRAVTQVLGGGFAFAFPSWSPDGKLIAFYAGPDGSHDIWVARSDGTEEWPISREPPDEYWPTFSPDGSRIAFGRNVGTACCQWRLVVAEPDGSAESVLETEPLGAVLPSVWSPDGTILLARSGDPELDRHPLLMLDPDGQRPPAEIDLGETWANFSWQRVADPHASRGPGTTGGG